jgi:diadenosine tetraphosphatase ApaH/serine/threonine PP2A family protein phosphatase
MPETLEDFAGQSSAPPSLWIAVREMMATTRALLGEERLAWLRALPRVHFEGPLALVHASPESPWRSPGPEAADAELNSIYGPLGRPFAIYGHIHRPFIRSVSGMTVANTGSVSLSYDGDVRAAYLMWDGSEPTIRRVEYELDKELRTLSSCGIPHSGWISRTLRSATPQMP